MVPHETLSPHSRQQDYLLLQDIESPLPLLGVNSAEFVQ